MSNRNLDRDKLDFAIGKIGLLFRFLGFIFPDTHRNDIYLCAYPD